MRRRVKILLPHKQMKSTNFGGSVLQHASCESSFVEQFSLRLFLFFQIGCYLRYLFTRRVGSSLVRLRLS